MRMHITDAAESTNPKRIYIPSTTVSTPESTPSIDRLALGVATAREGATTSGIPFTPFCSASSED
jgi:hypothetical protein